MAGENAIRQLASSGAFRSVGKHRIAEPAPNRTLPVVDNSDPGAPNVRTSVDAYIAGQYLGHKGQSIEVVQRYTIFVSYSARTQAQTIAQVRERLLGDFQSRYGQQFNVSAIQIPGLQLPPLQVRGVRPGDTASAEFYMTAGGFREMTRTERKMFEIGSQRKIADTNIGSIRRYRYR